MKKIIPRVFHACIDYSLVSLLLAGPSIFISNYGVSAKCVSLFIGVFLALMNLFTAYEGGIIRLVNIRIHLLIEKLAGIFLIISPWLFDFSGQTFLFHVFAGLVLFGIGVFTHVDTPSELSPS
ncbi:MULTISPECIES: SPW repeat protein [Sphingobacterium]|uniref:SPW repeat domain-containing protein n=1 Tax=Sphingobacterium TaxID=28453 RepID=UPI0013DACFFC|nr:MULTISPECIES: SPW repeat protein [unclassified Sphingobacterium]